MEEDLNHMMVKQQLSNVTEGIQRRASFSRAAAET